MAPNACGTAAARARTISITGTASLTLGSAAARSPHIGDSVMTNPILEIRNLHARIEDREILKGVNLVIPPGEVHAVMGRNGSGKSTLSYVLAGKEDYEVTGGEVLLDGVNILELEPDERAAAGMFLALQ